MSRSFKIVADLLSNFVLTTSAILLIGAAVAGSQGEANAAILCLGNTCGPNFPNGVPVCGGCPWWVFWCNCITFWKVAPNGVPFLTCPCQ